MDTTVRTPQMVFMQPQRLVVPLFQRPYVWNEENQWEPLWEDVTRTAGRVLAKPFDKHPPHFLGAVVLQQVQNTVGRLQQRTIIDGQQRLTTLQLMMDALHAQLVAAGANLPAQRLEPLVENSEAFCTHPDDRFKVWPTNRDRPAFNAVMSATSPVDYASLRFPEELMQRAHRFFAESAKEWLFEEGDERVQTRAAALETAVRELLQLVVIELTVEENAQEIFETLNARGAQLTAADLIKNFIFQRMMESGAQVEALYEKYWKDFETAFWEAEVSAGRTRTPRSSLFLNHWLVARTGEEVVAREVFDRFKRYADHDAGLPMAELIQHLSKAAKVYRGFIEMAGSKTGPIERLGLFGYRTGVLESEVVKPLALYLLDPQDAAIPEHQLTKALSAVESWMVRRMLCRATTKSYNQIIAELVKQLRNGDRSTAGDVVESFLAGQTASSRHWPDDEELRNELSDLMIYKRIGKGRLRMVLEALEDHARGWHSGKPGLGGERVSRYTMTIEHVMPVKWPANWPLTPGGMLEDDRDRLVHTLGNLTLLLGKLNGKVSNGPWTGTSSKRQGLESHDVLFMNRNILKRGTDGWAEAQIRSRTIDMISTILQVWAVPPGHKSGFVADKAKSSRRIKLIDLISAGVLLPGAVLTPRRKEFADRTGTVMADGRIELDGQLFDSPSLAAVHLTKYAMSGWWFFFVDSKSKRSLKIVRREYLESLQAEDDEDDGDEDDDDEE